LFGLNIDGLDSSGNQISPVIFYIADPQVIKQTINKFIAGYKANKAFEASRFSYPSDFSKPVISHRA
jgi:hypothetical protein